MMNASTTTHQCIIIRICKGLARLGCLLRIRAART